MEEYRTHTSVLNGIFDESSKNYKLLYSFLFISIYNLIFSGSESLKFVRYNPKVSLNRNIGYLIVDSTRKNKVAFNQELPRQRQGLY